MPIHVNHDAYQFESSTVTLLKKVAYVFKKEAAQT